MRGSLARVGLLATSNLPLSEVRATVGRFVSIRCANSTIVAMITDVTSEDLPTSDRYVAHAGVDLLGGFSANVENGTTSAAEAWIESLPEAQGLKDCV